MKTELNLRDESECRYDALSLGEVMLRLDPGEGRIIYGLMKTGDAEIAVNYGAAHGALAMTTPGDTTMASKKEVEALINGIGARVQR